MNYINLINLGRVSAIGSYIYPKKSLFVLEDEDSMLSKYLAVAAGLEAREAMNKASYSAGGFILTVHDYTIRIGLESDGTYEA